MIIGRYAAKMLYMYLTRKGALVTCLGAQRWDTSVHKLMRLDQFIAASTRTTDTNPCLTKRPVLDVDTLPQIKFFRSGRWGAGSMQKGRGLNWACRATLHARKLLKVTKPVALLCLVASVGSRRRTDRARSASRSPSPLVTTSSLPPSPKVERFWGVAKILSKNVPVASRSTSPDFL